MAEDIYRSDDGTIVTSDGRPVDLAGQLDDDLSATFAKAADFRSTPTGSGVPTQNIIVGHSGNAVASDLGACTIGGGGQANYENIIGGDGSATVNTPTPNVTQEGTGANYSVIAGGYDNVAGGLASVVTGFHNYTALGTSHGSILGGSGHKITAGNYGTISGGTKNTVSGTHGTVGGGYENTAAANATAAGGHTNQATGEGSAIGGGMANQATGIYSTIPGGRFNLASSPYATALGRSAAAYTEGMVAHASGQFATPGDAQFGRLILRRQTTDDTPAVLGYNGAAASHQMRDDSSVHFRAQVVARDTSNGDSKAWTIEGLATNDTGAAVSFVGGTPTATVVAEDAGAEAWDLTVTGGTDSLNFYGTGEADKTINWVATVEFTEVVG